MVSTPARVADFADMQIKKYVSTADSCRALRVTYNVGIREFVILAFVSDADHARPDEIHELLGLSPTTVDLCLTRLVVNELVHHSNDAPRRYQLTPDGKALMRKAVT